MKDSSTQQAAPPVAAKEQPSAQTLSTRQITGIIGALALAAFVMILNETVLTVALPAIMENFLISADAGQWLTTGFLLTMSIVIPMTGYLLQRFTQRSLFVVALCSFIVGLVLAAVAPNFAILLIARVIQAIGTAIVLPLLMTSTLSLVPVKNRGMVMGLNSIVISVGPAIGPTVSGIIVSSLSWRWIFGIMTPLALLILVAGIIFIRVPSSARKLPVDIFSVVLSAFAFGGLVYAISTFGAAAEQPTAPAVSGGIGLVALALFIVRQLRLAPTGRELLNLKPFQNRTFTLSVVLIMIAMGTLLGTVVIIPIVLHNGAGLSTMTIGFMLLPGGLAQVIAAPIFGRVFDRFGPRPVLIPGAILLASGQWLFSTITLGTPLWLVVAFHVVFSVGLALLMTGLLSSALSTVPLKLYGHGSAIFNTGQQLGGAIGTTIFVTVLSGIAATEAQGGAPVDAGLFAGAHAAFLIGAIAATIGIVCAPFITGAKRP
ncbi:MDR family MFS transporter [Lysinibacter cavernae]|uniref:DHA2 family lincomycin resistance protein-like MFS transporter n=1 Tax=Lysinibacter cavernae TaxID=1640652 RepID=A0A7X5TRY7_9MICO|nr:DHA2 family lincomycin resistance protein-like MFS transporter [Lysinibacter cavernae]